MITCAFDESAEDYVLQKLHERIAAQQVIPFLGSGLAMALGYKPWAGFLREAAARHSPALSMLVNERISESEFEVAADLIHSCDAAEFLVAIHEHYGRETPELAHASALYKQPAQLREDPAVPAAALLPLIFSGPVVTSAFDPAIATLYRAAGRPFAREVTAPEGGLINQLTVHQRLLVRLHGSLDVPHSRILLSVEHRATFLDDKQTRDQLRIDLNKAHPNLLRHLCSLRSLLFIGCGLNHDYTLEVLERVTEFLPDSRHFALLPGTPSRALSRRLQRYNIEPIFYPDPTEQPQALTVLLQRLARLAAASSPAADLENSGPHAPDKVRTRDAGSRPDTLSRSELRRLIDQRLRSEEDLMAFLNDHFPRVALQIAPRMTRKEKVTLLFTYEETEIVHRKLLQEISAVSAHTTHVTQAAREMPATSTSPPQPPPPRSSNVELLLPVGINALDLIKLLRGNFERREDPEADPWIGSFADLMHGDGQRLQLTMDAQTVTLIAQPPLLSPHSGSREPEIVLPRRAGPASPRIFLYFPRRQIGESYTLSVEASPTVRLKLVAPGQAVTPTLVFVERSAQ